jgi:hypothetical protein
MGKAFSFVVDDPRAIFIILKYSLFPLDKSVPKGKNPRVLKINV